MGMHHVGPCITTLTDGKMKETIERGEERRIYIYKEDRKVVGRRMDRAQHIALQN